MQKQADFMPSIGGHFTPALLNEKDCRTWILKQLHPKGVTCPDCGAAVTSEKVLSTWENMGRISCRSCSRFFTAASGTILQGAKLDIQTLYALALLLSFNVPFTRVAQTLKISYGTVNSWEIRLKLAGILPA